MKTKEARKAKAPKIDGLSPQDIKKIRIAIRQVWSWSHPRRLCLKRCQAPNDMSKCECCGMIVPRVYVDHIRNVGDVDGGFIQRLFCPSSGLQGLCKFCHAEKTKLERKHARDTKLIEQEIEEMHA